MKYHKLGKTGLDVSMIGLGTEYLINTSRKTVVSVVHNAIEREINYIDLFWAFPEIRDNFGAALKACRDKVILAGHLGSAVRDGQYLKTRSKSLCERYFVDLLSRLDTDYVDILMLHFVDTRKDYEKVFNEMLELARRFQREKKVRFIGMSGHSLSIALKAVKSGQIDVLMYPINLIGGSAIPGIQKLLNACLSQGIGLVAMKPFAGGKLLWRGFQKKISTSITPIQCITYTLSHKGVSTVVPGVKNIDELKTALESLDATNEEKDFSSIVANLRPGLKGECLYCNHCLPCPVDIDIGQTIRLLETAEHTTSYDLGVDYNSLSTKASACIKCGVCMERCPFKVDVISKIEQAARLFEQIA